MADPLFKDIETGWIAKRSEWGAAHVKFADEYFADHPELDSNQPVIKLTYNLEELK